MCTTAQQINENTEEQQRDGHGCTPAHVIDGTVWTLRTAAHFTDIQQICGKRIKNGLVEAL